VVARGGHVLVTYFSGIVDTCDHIRLGGYPGAFRELLGVRSEEFAPLAPGATVTLDDGSTADLWTELLTTAGAEVVASYTDGPLPGTPAVTRNGTAWYVATRLDEAATAALAERVLDEAGVTRTGSDGVEVVRRGKYVFVLNRSSTEAVVPVTGTELISGTAVAGSVSVAAGCAAVIRAAVIQEGT
jgi:beta-galactosidase